MRPPRRHILIAGEREAYTLTDRATYIKYNDSLKGNPRLEILVEGGGALAAALLRARLVDEVHWFAAPRLLGAEGRPALGPLEVAGLARAPQLEEVQVRRTGRDVHVVGWLGR